MFGLVAGGAETDLSDAQFCGAVAVPSGTETNLNGAQFCVVQWLRLLDLSAVPAAVVLVKVTHVTFLAVLWLLSVFAVVEVNGRDGVPRLGLLLALASKRAASALRRVRFVLILTRFSVIVLRIHLHELHGQHCII